MHRQLKQMLCLIPLPLQAENGRVLRRPNMEDYHGQTLQAHTEAASREWRPETIH